ncbi:MAG: membrane protein FxsA [Calditrichaeota bacterium]|nr:membrane protein FxsA [Calditrichota bacterium]
MFTKLFLLFITIPFVELILLIKVGEIIGLVPTLAIVISTGLLGASLARSQGFSVLNRIQQSLQQGQLPADPLFDGVFVLAGGLLLLTPGFLTDITGFLCLIPGTREIFKRWVRAYFQNKIRFQDPFNTYPPDDF